MTSCQSGDREACVGNAIVTGASSGIGHATALRLAGAGYDLGLTYNTNQNGVRLIEAAVQALGRRAVSVKVDLADAALATAGIIGLIESLDGVDVLVNSAGVNRRAKALEETAAGWEHTLAVDLIAPWACARAAAAHMIRADRGGRIINVTSVLAYAPIDGGAAYCAAKAGLEILTKVMALELAEHQITVNAVAPGHTATPMNFTEAELTESTILRPVIPTRRAATPAEVAAAIVFLASPEASYATGASLVVDGGLLLASGPESLQRETGFPPKPPQGAR
jgi:NAD(P)-dependent dehydrogenase (short-subunit alcohol dehydrogenase family)